MTKAEIEVAAGLPPPPKYKLPASGPDRQGPYLLIQYLRDLDHASIEDGVLWVYDLRAMSKYMIPLDDFDLAYNLGWVEATDPENISATKKGLYWLDRFLRLNPLKVADALLLMQLLTNPVVRRASR